MMQDCVSLHPSLMVSSNAPKGTPRMPSSLRSSRINSIACRKFSRHSSRDSPWPLAPGTPGQYPTNQPPSRSMIAVNSCFISRLYETPRAAPSRLEIDRLVLHRAERVQQPLVERWVRVNGEHHFLHRSFQFQRSDRLADQFGRARSDDVHAQYLAVLSIGDNLDESIMVADDRSL